MKITFDSSPLYSGHATRGVGVYARELLGSLNNIAGSDNSLEIEEAKTVGRADSDIVHVLNFNPFVLNKSILTPSRAKKVITIYDLIPLIYPAHYPPGIKGKISFLIQKMAIQSFVSGIITISETSKKDICRFLGVNPDKVTVIHLAARDNFRRTTDRKYLDTVARKYNLPKEFVLYVGDINYNKNISALIQACKKLGIKLVMVGKQISDFESLDLNHPELRHLKIVSDLIVDTKIVVRPGFVEDTDLNGIFNLASVYCLPSLYEGYGLPAVEAFASGTPVVAVKSQAMVEICGDTALFTKGSDSDSIARAIDQVLKDSNLRMKMIEDGIKIAKSRKWDDVGKETLATYKSILEK